MKQVFGACGPDHPGSSGRERGVALLAVLWLAVALTFVGMATAHMVRTEISAASNQIDWQGSYYLARGGIDAAIYSIANPPATAQLADPAIPVLPSDFVPGKRWLQYEFPGGSCTVEVMPETAKVNINLAQPEQLAELFTALGVPPAESAELAAAIVDWRSPRTSDVGSGFDLYYASLPQPYLARHAALENIEELLPVRGMDRNLLFGRFEGDDSGHWQKRSPLHDLLTTQTTTSGINPNYARYEVLRSLPGWNDAMAAAVINARMVAPIQSLDELLHIVPRMADGAALGFLTMAQGPVYTLTATAFLPGSGVRRSVRALILIDTRLPLLHHVLAWWDDWPMAGELPNNSGNTNRIGES